MRVQREAKAPEAHRAICEVLPASSKRSRSAGRCAAASGGPVRPASTHQLLEIHVEHRKELLSINLSNLVPSFNVRRHPPGRVEELAELIGSQGLLHPLIVTAGSAMRREQVD